MTIKKQHRKRWKILREALRCRTSISHAELSLLVKKHTNVAVDYAVWKFKREGVLVGSRRGLYLIAEQAERNTFVKSPIEAIHSLLGKDIVFGYGTALFVHGLSRYGRLTEYYVLSTRDIKPKRIGDVLVRFIENPLRDEVGIVRHKFGRSIIRVSDLERTLIDCIHRPKYTQGWENVMHALGRAKRFNAHRLIEYVKKYGVPLLAARVGVILEHFEQRWKARAQDIDSLLPYIPRRPVKFQRGIKGKLNKKWNIYLPADLLDE